MKFLLDSSHPAHVHFFAAIGQELEGRGHRAVLALREKDVAHELAEASGLACVQSRSGSPLRRRPRTGRVSEARELVARVRWLRRTIQDGGFEVVVTRNPSGAIAAWLARRPSILDTDDGTAAGLHFMLARPFASLITTPELLPEDFGPRHRRYAGLKSTVFLHPDRFSPDATVLGRYGLDGASPIVVARFSANDASHDRGVRSVPQPLIDGVRSRLAGTVDLIMSREGMGTWLYRRDASTAPSPVAVRPVDFLHLLAQADLFVGDSGSVTMEAAALGIPTLRIADTRRAIITALAQDFGLVHDHELDESGPFLRLLDHFLDAPQALREPASAGHTRLQAASVDVASWFADLCEGTARPH